MSNKSEENLLWFFFLRTAFSLDLNGVNGNFSMYALLDMFFEMLCF